MRSHPHSLRTAAVLALTAAALLQPFSFASAADGTVAPGRYEVTMGVAGNNMVNSICLRSADVQTAATLARTFEDDRCKQRATVDTKPLGARAAAWQTVCKSEFTEMTTVGELRYDSDAYQGQMKRTMGTIVLDIPFKARHIGDCN